MHTMISIRFLTGRAHLHPWQAHHSDGTVDWPPSPWRLLRSLVGASANGLTTLPEPNARLLEDTEGDQIPLSRLANLLATLSAPPEVWLPVSSGGHTRQYFPIHEAGIVKNSGSAVFDTFVAISKEAPIYFSWPGVVLDQQHIDELTKILRRLTYFGRAESWCEATLVTSEIADRAGYWRSACVSPREQLASDPGHTLERKLAPLLPLASGLRAELAELLPKCKPRPPKPSQLNAALSGEPEAKSLLRCLLRASGEDIQDGLERPIGRRWVHYAVPRAIYQLSHSKPRRTTSAEAATTLIRFTLNTATVNRPVLPPLTDTLLVADKLRAAALAWCGHIAPQFPADQWHPRNLCGREPDGSRIMSNDHAFFWPTDENNDGLIDHISVFCPAGFKPIEADALRRLLRIRQRGGRPDLLLTPIFLGPAENFDPWKGSASTFISATPYFCPVHLSHGKSRGSVRSVVDEIRKSLLIARVIESGSDLVRVTEWVFPGFLSGPVTNRSDDPPDIPRYIGASLKNPDEALSPGFATGLYVDGGSRFIRALAFCRKRRHHVVNGSGRMLRLQFATPQRARPYSIGAQAHFGLGLFVPLG